MDARGILLLTVAAALSIDHLAVAQRLVQGPLHCEPRVMIGRVVDVDGRGVEGAEVDCRMRWGEDVRSLGRETTNSDGRFELQYERRPWRAWDVSLSLVVTAAGLAPSMLDNVFEPAPTFDFGPIVVHEPVELWGVVRSRAGAPIAGARVFGVAGPVEGLRPDLWGSPPIATSDSNGRYECRALPPGLVTLGVEAPGFADATDTPLMLRAANGQRFDFTLAPEIAATLRVLDSDGRPIAQAEAGPPGHAVGETPWFTYESTRSFWRAPERANEHGDIAIRGLPAGFDGDVRLRAPGFREAFAPARAGVCTVRLERVIWIDVIGERTSGDAPVELFEVRVRNDTPKNWRCGLAEDAQWADLHRESRAIDRVSGAHWRIAWNSPDCFVDGRPPSEVAAVATDGSFASVTVDATAPGEAVTCRLAFEPTTSLAGFVRNEAGEGVSATVGFRPTWRSSEFVCFDTDANGAFRIEHFGASSWLRAEGPFVLSCAWRELSSMSGARHADDSELEFVVTPTRPTPTPSGSIRGTLTIAGQPPGEPMLVMLDDRSQFGVWRNPTQHAWTDAAGRFEFPDAPIGLHKIAAKRAPNPTSGWRDFESELPSYGVRWPFSVAVYEGKLTEFDLRLPDPKVWDELAPERDF